MYEKEKKSFLSSVIFFKVKTRIVISLTVSIFNSELIKGFKVSDFFGCKYGYRNKEGERISGRILNPP